VRKRKGEAKEREKQKRRKRREKNGKVTSTTKKFSIEEFVTRK